MAEEDRTMKTHVLNLIIVVPALAGTLWTTSAAPSHGPSERATASEPRERSGVAVPASERLGGASGAKPPGQEKDSKTLVYADFERTENNRPVSARGGMIQMFGYEESKVHKSEFKGMEGADPPAPALVHIKPGDPNHAMKFDYVLHAPNQWAGVTVEIHGLPDVEGQSAPEDVSDYKTLSVQVYATGIQFLRLEAISKSRGKDSSFAWPQKTFQVKPGFNTYRVPLSAFSQPTWAQVRVDSKTIFKELTSINLTAFCDQCEYNKEGMVIVDNVVFEK
jgi:hypothetical protein